MKMKTLLAISAVVLLVVWLVGCGAPAGPPAPERDTVKPTIENPSVNPTSLRFTGGSVTISASVTDNVQVQSVNAVITKPDNTTETASMSLTTPDTYQTTYAAPANINTKNEHKTYQVQIVASDTSNNTSTASAPPFTVQAPEAPYEPPSEW